MTATPGPILARLSASRLSTICHLLPKMRVPVEDLGDAYEVNAPESPDPDEQLVEEQPTYSNQCVRI